MIAGLLRGIEADFPARQLIIGGNSSWTPSEFLAEAGLYGSALAARCTRRLAIHLPDSPQLLALLCGANLAGATVCVLNHDFEAGQLRESFDTVQGDLLVTDLDGPAPVDGPVVGPAELREVGLQSTALSTEEVADSEFLVLTSGTTGKPKCVRYLWSDLIRQVRESARSRGTRWLLTYHLNHFAGIQMFLHVLVNRAALVVPDSGSVSDMLATARANEVTHISASPTFWRFTIAQLRAEDRPLPGLQQITLGSEVVTPSLLERLEALFPGVRISQVYASTEAGSCVAVADGRAGLPVSILDYDEDAPVRFRIEDGELFIYSRHGMRGFMGETGNAQGEWRATGDLVRIEDDRIVFLGRQSEMINVGGVKVHPVNVEDAVSTVEGVKLAKAYGHPNAIMGQIVAVDIVLDDGADEEDIEERVFEACLSLDRHSRPRLVNVVPELDIVNRKLVRSN